MKRHEITKPIGLIGLCEKVENVCKNACVYKCGLRPQHLIVPLSAGSGRTTFIEYMTDMYKEYGIFDFSGSPDDYIEAIIDGSSSRSIIQGFDTFRAGAVYRNDYSNVAAVNIEDMAKYLMAPQFSDFIKEAKELCRNAYVVFFVSSTPSSNEEKLIAKLVDAIGKNNIHRADFEKYTTEDICCLIEKSVAEHGVMIENYQLFHTTLMDVVQNFNVDEIKAAMELTEELIHYSDFSQFIPTMSEKSLTLLAEYWNKKTERNEIK